MLALLAATGSLGALLAQSSPAPAASGAITTEERESAIKYLKDTQKDFLAAIDGVSDAQWKFKAAPDRWSIAETAEHIAIAEDLIWGRGERNDEGAGQPRETHRNAG